MLFNKRFGDMKLNKNRSTKALASGWQMHIKNHNELKRLAFPLVYKKRGKIALKKHTLMEQFLL